jgi:peptide/nickel transport system substrate-binding protein
LRFLPRYDAGVLDPHWSTSAGTRNHAFLVYDTLYGLDAQQQPQPQMLAGHQISPDATAWTLTLREGLRFHDGTPVLARDCVASIRRWASKDLFGQELLAATDELAAADDTTIRFRLKRPFPLLPMALGKSQGAAPMMMPERLAATNADRPVKEIVGSGPFRFLQDSYVPGAAAVYERFTAYRPREDGVPSGTAGPKRVFFERVEWHVSPDLGTAVTALRAGEADWIDFLLPDLMPVVKQDPKLVARVLEPHGLIAILRPNCVQPPFDNPAIRRLLLRTVDQAELMSALVGEDPALQHTPVGVFCPGTPMANEAGLEVLTAPRDYGAVRRDLAAAGYKGEPVALMVAADLPQYRAICDALTAQLQKGGFTVDYQATDWNTIVQRRAKRTPVAEGGWSGFVTNGWYGTDMLDPVVHTSLRGNGAKGWAGWPDSPAIERLRQQWMAAPSLAAQQALARQLQEQAWIDVPYVPLGQNFQPTAYRADLSGILDGFPMFWNVRRT